MELWHLSLHLPLYPMTFLGPPVFSEFIPPKSPPPLHFCCLAHINPLIYLCLTSLPPDGFFIKSNTDVLIPFLCWWWLVWILHCWMEPRGLYPRWCWCILIRGYILVEAPHVANTGHSLSSHNYMVTLFHRDPYWIRHRLYSTWNCRIW